MPERVVMDLCGWKTWTMCDRYNISRRDLTEGVQRLGGYLQASEPSATDGLQAQK